MPRLKTDSPDPYARLFSFPKWTKHVRVTEEHKLFRYLPEFQSFTRTDHEARSRAYLEAAIGTEHKYFDRVRWAEKRYGDHGPLISGIVRGHFPESVKTELRTLVRQYGEAYDRSVAHWFAAGKRIETWRETRDRMKEAK